MNVLSRQDTSQEIELLAKRRRVAAEFNKDSKIRTTKSLKYE